MLKDSGANTLPLGTPDKWERMAIVHSHAIATYVHTSVDNQLIIIWAGN